METMLEVIKNSSSDKAARFNTAYQHGFSRTRRNRSTLSSVPSRFNDAAINRHTKAEKNDHKYLNQNKVNHNLRFSSVQKVNEKINGAHVIDRPSSKPVWASYDIPNYGSSNDYVLRGFVNNEWKTFNEVKTNPVLDPLDKDNYIFKAPALDVKHLGDYISAIEAVPRAGLFNIYKNPEKFVEMGDVMAKAARLLHDEENFDYFVRLIQLTMPKSRPQAQGEVKIVRRFLENFSSDRVRMLMRGFTQAGDRAGQRSIGLRFPFGATAVIAPFNFPLEIVGMQFLGSVMVGNYCVVKPATSVAIVMEAFLEFLLHCGLDPNSCALLPTGGKATEQVLLNSPIQVTQFTGSSTVGERLAEKLKGKIKLEDAGFDVKILGPDVPPTTSSDDWKHITWQCDQDAYALSGQKCSATSFLAIHENWLRNSPIEKSEFIHDLAQLTQGRSVEDLSLGPILGHDRESCRKHLDILLSLPGAKLLFGGQVSRDGMAVPSHEALSVRPGGEFGPIKVPSMYGLMAPSAVFVPLKSLMALPKGHSAFNELFGPLQLVTAFNDSSLDDLLKLVDSFSHHLTAGVVSNESKFLNKVLGATIHGVTYAGNRARTTGAPQNHWFGPSGDPRGCGIGTNEAILHTWTNHREVVMDQGPTGGIERFLS